MAKKREIILLRGYIKDGDRTLPISEHVVEYCDGEVRELKAVRQMPPEQLEEYKKKMSANASRALSTG